MAAPQWIKIGLVGRPHGLKGDFFVAGRDEKIPPTYQSISIGSDPGWGDKAEIVQVREQGGQSVIRCTVSTTRESAEALCGRPIWITRDQVEIDESRSYLWGDLMGRAVEDKAGVALGHVFQIYNVGASDILVVRAPDGRALEIAMSPAYFSDEDLSELSKGQAIRLLVEQEVFADFWQERLQN